ncbi:MAG: prolyl oligopeptidase family serine peptidase [Gemmataceae bacterium]
MRWALDYDEMYITTQPKRDDVATAKAHIKTGLQRAKELRDGKPSWTTATGLLVRGYKSKIDGSVQPYGLVIPPEYDFKGDKKHRLDFWWHGRSENNLELSFIAERQRNKGEFTPPGAIVVHPFGRFSNANKFAGEIDSFEVLDHVRKHYRIDDSRIVARGFSMGGAACWQYAVHYPTLFCAAAPGAGFAETKEFLGNFQNEKVKPEWWEQKLWRMYDATEYAGNLFNLPTVAYSGENDRQKQAADIMVKYAKAAGVEFPHVIGAKAGHNYTPDARKEINEKIDAVVAKGLPKDRSEIKFTTYTLRYNQCDWLTVTGLERHWEKATVSGTRKNGAVNLTTSGVTTLRVRMPQTESGSITVDGKAVAFNLPFKDGEVVAVQKDKSGWSIPIPDERDGKSPGLQGPIDDAFMGSFLMVRPTGTPVTKPTGEWVQKEMKHATDHWRKQFRGDAPIKDDKDVTADDIKNNNLVLWGDAASNAVLGKMAAKLPFQWVSRKEGEQVVTHLTLGGDTYDSASHMPVLIFPNPLNPAKYVVLNSGFTYREYDYLNNARQVPKLPDYAVIDVSTPANSRFPGKVVRAGFFDEQWKLQKDDGKGSN